MDDAARLVRGLDLQFVDSGLLMAEAFRGLGLVAAGAGADVVLEELVEGIVVLVMSLTWGKQGYFRKVVQTVVVELVVLSLGG